VLFPREQLNIASSRSFLILEINPPDLSQIDYDNVYLSVKFDSTYSAVGFSNPAIGHRQMIIRTGRFWNKQRDIYNYYYPPYIDSDYGDKSKRVGWVFYNPYNNIPADFNNFINEYWTDGTPAGNTLDRDYYSTESEQARTVRGGRILDVTDEIEHMNKLWFLLDGRGKSTINVYQTMFLIEKKHTLKTNVYMPYGGRLDSSKRLIDNPIDIIRDLCKRQNWSELAGDIPANGWGSGRSTLTRVKEFPDDEIGSFDYAGLDDIKQNIKCNFVEKSYDKSWTDKLTKRICQQFWLLQYQDEAGYECIDFFVDAFEDEIVDTITLNQIIGPVDPIIYPDQKDIFVNPIVYYNIDHGTGEYRNYIQVTNAEQPDYDPSYIREYGKNTLDVSLSNVIGTPTIGSYIRGGSSGATARVDAWTPAEGSDDPEIELYDISGIFETGEELTEYSDSDHTTPTGFSADVLSKIDPYGIWDLAHNLWTKYHQDNEPPASMINLDMITDSETAAWYLKTWLTWQNKKRIKFTVPYEVASGWHVGTRFGISLPHQTDGIKIYCLVERIRINVPLRRRRDTVKITAIMYNLDELEDNIIQDIYERPNYDWVDVETTDTSGTTTQDAPI
jgi:hypothetical protein